MPLAMKNLENLIENVVFSFYELAIKDVMIGYHFRKIQEYDPKDPLTPPIEAFKSHLPKISQFWCSQLLNKKNEDPKAQNVLKAHQYLSVRKGEVGRWVALFLKTLDTFESKEINESELELLKEWKKKIEHFRIIFLESKVLFP